jgi:hypothetical protein
MSVLLMAATHAAGIVVAGIFSSQIATLPDEVLLASQNCGWVSEKAYKDFNKLQSSDLAAADALFVLTNSNYRKSAEYARSCYDGSPGLHTTVCTSFFSPLIESTISRTEECPFEEDICRSNAITLDSGMIDTSQALGINSKPGSELQFRKFTSCAPIVGDGRFDEPWTMTPPLSLGNTTDELYRPYHFGPYISFGQFAGNETFYYKKNWSAMQNNEYILW